MRYIFFTFSYIFFSVKEVFFSKKFFNIKRFFHIKTFFSANNIYFVKTNYLFKKNIFFNLVLQQMNNPYRKACSYNARRARTKHTQSLPVTYFKLNTKGLEFFNLQTTQNNITSMPKCDFNIKITFRHGCDVVLVFLLLTLNILHTFFQCFHC